MKKSIFVLAALVVLAPFTFGKNAWAAGPMVGAVAPLTATYTVPQQFYVTASDSAGVVFCTLVISSIYETPMTLNVALNRYEATYTFTTERTANSIRAKCTNGAGDVTTGPAKIVSVSEVVLTPTDGSASVEVDATDWTRDAVIAVSPVLIKTPCPGGEDFTHPCRTVYFLDKWGGRHAFPNEKVYFTWYNDWSNIHVISSTMMASYTLGPNVVYKPGVKMVKFPSLNTVYAVARYGILRPIDSEAVASALYGANWNKQIDDVSEAFYKNYNFGELVHVASDFHVDVERGAVVSINDNLQ